MDKQIHPLQGVKDSVEFHYHRHNSTSKVLYIGVILFLLLTFLSLKFINVTISVRGNGIIRPENEKTIVKSLIPGIVDKIYVSNGQIVDIGDTLITIQDADLSSKINLCVLESQELQIQKNDLKILLSDKNKWLSNIKSGIYIKDVLSYQKRLHEIEEKINRAKRDIKRNKHLYAMEIISAKDMEDLELNYSQYVNHKQILQSEYYSKWEKDLHQIKSSIRQLQSEKDELHKQKAHHIITATIAGTLEEFEGIYIGTSIQTGQEIAIISPDAKLVTEIYITPKDIGYIEPNGDVRIQVDAFNYNEWGTLTGRVESISNDFILINNQPIFKVRCSLDKNYLMLKNGTKGQLKKGMTVKARFLLSERPALNLLYEDIDDWVNPSRSSIDYEKED